MPKADINLNATHASYAAQISKYELWRDIYEGKEKIEGRSLYLAQNSLETARQYAFRLNRSTYRNYAKPIVNVWNSHVWRKPPQRKLPSSLAQYLPDVDRKTTPADRFFSEITRKALYLGVQFVLVDTPPGSARTRQGSRNLGPSSLLGVHKPPGCPGLGL
jgi:hypothetical protein